MDNPYTPPDTEIKSPPPSQSKDSDLRELFGVAANDFWYYPGFLLLVAAWFVSNFWAVLVLLAVSTAFLIIYLVKSFPKFLGSSNLHIATKIYGLFGNVFLIMLHVVVIVWKFWTLLAW
jgi:hypothetical protein